MAGLEQSERLLWHTHTHTSTCAQIVLPSPMKCAALPFTCVRAHTCMWRCWCRGHLLQNTPTAWWAVDTHTHLIQAVCRAGTSGSCFYKERRTWGKLRASSTPSSFPSSFCFSSEKKNGLSPREWTGARRWSPCAQLSVRSGTWSAPDAADGSNPRSAQHRSGRDERERRQHGGRRRRRGGDGQRCSGSAETQQQLWERTLCWQPQWRGNPVPKMSSSPRSVSGTLSPECPVQVSLRLNLSFMFFPHDPWLFCLYMCVCVSPGWRLRHQVLLSLCSPVTDLELSESDD